MKKIYMILAAALVMSAANSCDKANVSQDNFSVEPMVVNFTAKVIDTKTIFNPSLPLEDGASVPVLWTGNEGIDIYVNEKALSGLVPEIPVQIEGEASSTTAFWSYDFSELYDGTFSGGYVPEAPFTFYAFCPGKNTRAFYNASKQRILVDGIPAEQTPGENSCDEAAMMICSISQEYTLWPDEVEMPDFKHMTAYGCITLGSGAPTEGVKKVSVTANAGQYLAGSAWYYYAGEKEGEWENYSNPGTETITINTESGENIWFGCRPTTGLSSLTFEVFTETGETYKVVKDLTDKNLNFTAGKVAMMTINGFERVEEEEDDQETITYTWTAADSKIGFITGTNNTAEGLDWNDKVVSQTFTAGTPALQWVVNATATGKYNIACTSVSASITEKRLKVGSESDLFNPVTFTITPIEGYKVKAISVYTSVNKATSNYMLSASVGETSFLNDEKMVASKKPAAFTAEVDEAVEGPVEITISGETADVFYLYKMEIVLVK